MISILKKYKKTLGIIGVVIVGFVLYSMFLKPDEAQEGVVSNAPTQQTQAGREILTLLVDLRQLELDGELFQSSAFRSLEDFSIPIAPEPQGRPNPFAPIGQDQEVTAGGGENDEVQEGESGSGTE